MAVVGGGIERRGAPGVGTMAKTSVALEGRVGCISCMQTWEGQIEKT